MERSKILCTELVDILRHDVKLVRHQIRRNNERYNTNEHVKLTNVELFYDLVDLIIFIEIIVFLCQLSHLQLSDSDWQNQVVPSPEEDHIDNCWGHLRCNVVLVPEAVVVIDDNLDAL